MMRNILFVCEGSTEIFLLYKILEKEFKIRINESLKDNGNLVIKKIDDMESLIVEFAQTSDINIFIGNLDGETNLSDYITELCENRFFYNLDRILFLMDADFSSGEDTGFERTKKAIEREKEKLKINEELKVDYYIMPNNERDGMSETLLVDILKCKEITSYIKDEVIPKVKTLEGQEIKNEEKSRFMMIAATQNPLRATASSFISSCYNKFDKTHVDFIKLKNFIKKGLGV